MSNEDIIIKLKKEQKDLGENLKKLNDFLEKGDVFKVVNNRFHVTLLFEQRDAMNKYHQILSSRILLLD